MLLDLAPTAGAVLIDQAVLLGLIATVVGTLAGAVAMLYKQGTMAHERDLALLREGHTAQMAAVQATIGMLTGRIDVLTGREATLLATVGEKDRYVLEILNGIVTSTRDATMAHDLTIKTLVSHFEQIATEAKVIGGRAQEEHRVILDAIKINEAQMVRLMQRQDNHERRQQAHREEEESGPRNRPKQLE